MKKHPLSSLSFLKPLPELETPSFEEITKEADKSYRQDSQTEENKNLHSKRKVLTLIQNQNEKTPLIKEINLSSQFPIIEKQEDKVITLQTIEENAKKFKENFNEITNVFKEQIKELSEDLQQSKQQLDTLLSLKKKEKSSFFPSFFKRKKQETYRGDEEDGALIFRKHPTSTAQIINSKTLLSYASDWTKTIFADRILFKAVPGSGTILLILPKGNIRFIQFNYKDTPVHPTQESFKSHLAPNKVYEFNQFIDYRNWLYNEMRNI